MANRTSSKKLSRNDPRHGTNTGYNYYSCRCKRCRQAHTEYAVELRRKRKPLKRNDPRHGTPNGYNNLSCRCKRCKEAWAADIKKRRARRKARG